MLLLTVKALLLFMRVVISFCLSGIQFSRISPRPIQPDFRKKVPLKVKVFASFADLAFNLARTIHEPSRAGFREGAGGDF